MRKAFCYGFTYKKPILVKEFELLFAASTLAPKNTLKTRLMTIKYEDMKAAVETALDNEFSYWCHGDIFTISRHDRKM